jgi:transposase InsO family protein
MLVLVDEASSYVWTFSLKAKGEVASTVTAWLAQEERQSGHSVRVFMSDNGSEFINSTMANLCATKGIRRETTIPYTPQQNGKLSVTIERWKPCYSAPT